MAVGLELSPPNLGAEGSRYESWLRSRPGAGDDYLRSEARVRFEPRDGDLLVAVPGLVASAAAGGTTLVSPHVARAVPVPGAEPAVVSRFLAALDGSATLAVARQTAGLDGPTERALLDAAFGLLLFTPFAVSRLDHELSCLEIVRFPATPYELERPYWENMVSVRRAMPALETALGDPRDAFRELCHLHVLALLGKKLDSFYRPASRIAKNGIAPGTLWQTPTRTAETSSGTRFLEGPRVHAPLLGGPGYAALLAELTGDPEATLERREHTDGGLEWGRVLTGSAEGDPAPLPWFCPPRPLTEAHAAALFGALGDAVDAARAGRREATVTALADFHQRFVRLHPFRACNQALAMNLVNAVLARVTGAGMPHLLLDHAALRFAPAAYRRLFALAAEAWCVPAPTNTERLTASLAKKNAYYGLVSRLTAAEDASAARVAAELAPDAARLALLALD